MKIDNANRCVYNDIDLFDLIMQGFSIDELIYDNADRDNKILNFIDCKSYLNYEPITNVEEFHKKNQLHWLMDSEYKDLDIETHCLNLCKTEVETQRVNMELNKFKEYELLDLLKYIKFMVDSFKKHNILWGIGRGSSVSSYILYLLGIHAVDSLKYKLDFSEFLK